MMDINTILNELNQEQKTAATHIDGPQLILAGAGSGKTKTITTRLAYIIAQGIPASSTLTLTFTNKAANEMRQRAYGLLSRLNISKIGEPLLCTFHHFGMLVLRRYIHLLGYSNAFNIIDQTDRKKIIKDILKEYKDKEVGYYSRYIESIKNDLIDDEEQYAMSLVSEKSKRAYEVYQRYTKLLKSNNYLDFDDLLYLAYRLLSSNESIKHELSTEYQYITVDEYQDTNKLQLELLKLLCTTHQNICVVGDEDQCIYSFRGSRIDNILDFTKQFNGAKLIRLEQNYRCTEQILSLANTLIAHNKKRLGKNLYTTKKSTHEVQLNSYANAYEEASAVVTKIKSLIKSGATPSQIAVLYRLNSLSMLLEEQLMKENVAYALIGSVSFYERMEIKDAMSYLRLAHNLDDDISFARVINTPKRGFGDVFVAKLKAYASANGVSMFKALASMQMNTKQQQNASKFVSAMTKCTQASTIDELLQTITKDIDLSSAYMGMDNYDDKCDNLKTFFASLKDKATISNLGDILNELTLYDSHQKMDKNTQVYLMSIHASKGLEFDNVFLIGCEEGTFPSQMNDNIEEERRLCYVAFTRAKERLYISYANNRMKLGKIKSRFIAEAYDADDSAHANSASFAKADRVKHQLFGIGRVVDIRQDKDRVYLTINFAGSTKTIISDYVSKL